MSRGRIFFNSSPNPTIGVEVELQILDNEYFELASAAGDILSEFQDSLHVKEEILDSIIEINTAPYQRKISVYQQNNDFKDIMKNAIVELKSEFEVYA